MVWNKFLLDKGVQLDETHIGTEYFCQVPFPLMCRGNLKSILGAFSLIYLTRTAKMWMNNLDSSYNDDFQEIIFPGIYLLTRRAMDCFLEWLSSNSENVVETVIESKDED